MYFRSLIPALVLALILPPFAMAQSSRPGNDFFAYANAEWLRATSIPAGKGRWGARDEINRLTRQRVLSLLDEAHHAAVGTPGAKVAAFQAAWLNRSAINARGLEPLRAVLDSIAGLRDKTALARFLGSWVRADVDPLNWGVYQSAHLIGLAVEPSIHGEKEHVAFLLQGGLGLERVQYLDTTSTARTERGRYQAHIARLLSLAKLDASTPRAAAVLALETALARSYATPEASASDRRADTVWTAAQFEQHAPGMAWSAFLAGAGLERVAAFGAWQPGAIAGIAEQVAAQPLLVWQDYLRFHLLDEFAEALSEEFAAATTAFHSDTQSTRESRAVDVTLTVMSEPIGRMYSERWFPESQKQRVRRIVAAVHDAFEARVARAAWLSPASREIALAKLKRLYTGIGFPEQWPSLDGLRIDRSDPVGNLQRVAHWQYQRTLDRLGQPVARNSWWMPPQQAGAILIFQQNTYQFSAALLQAPKFDATASDAATFGAIGAIIGHDISHFVDLLGAEYDVDGAMRGWWTSADRAGFDSVTAPLVRQFSGYRPLPDVAVDGLAGRTENVADLAGLTAAFDAHRLALGARVSDTAYVRRADREFFTGWAQGWRVKFTDAVLRQQSGSDHAPEIYRVNTVRNFDAWYDAFDVVPGDALYLPPAARVRVW